MWLPFSTRRRPASRTRRAVCNPCVESLENRRVLSAFAASAGTPGQDSGQSIGTDAAGNVYVAGNVAGTQSDIDTDIYVAKYSTDGALQWSFRTGGPFGDSANAIAVDSAGDSFVAGDFRGQVTFGNFTLTSTGPIDGFVMELNTTGNVMWVHQFANTGNFGPYTYERLGTLAPKGIALDHVGNVVVTGWFTGHIDMDPANPGQHYLDYPNGHPGTYVVKLDGNGNFVWEAEAVNPVDDIVALSVAVDSQNNVYTLGIFGNHNWFNDKTAKNSDQPNANSLAIDGPNWSTLCVWKLNADGTNAWVSQVESSPQYESIWGLGIAVDNAGNIYTTGAFNGANVDFDPTVSHAGNPDIISSAGGNYDSFVSKMDSGGHFVWVRQIVSSDNNWGTGLALDSAGDTYITGYLSADSLAGNILLTSASPAGNSYVAELSPAGDFLAAQKSLNRAPDGDQGAAIAVDSKGFVDITGAFSSTMQWPGLPLLSSAGAGDIFTEKIALAPSPITYQLQGTVLLLTGTSQADKIVITDDRNWGILVYRDDSPALAFQGLTEIDANTRGGGDVVNVLCPDDNTNKVCPLPNLRLDLGGGGATVNVLANLSQGARLNGQAWQIGVTVAYGDTMFNVAVIGAVPVAVTANLGKGNDSGLFAFTGIEGMRCPDDNLTLHAGAGNNDFRAVFTLPISSGDLGAQPPITVNMDAQGKNHLEADYNILVNAAPSAPAVFHTPLSTTLSGGNGENDASVVISILPAVQSRSADTVIAAPISASIRGGNGVNHAFVEFDAAAVPGTENGIIAVLAPVSVYIAGGGTNSEEVDFGYQEPTNLNPLPMLEIETALQFELHGGPRNDVLTAHCGWDGSRLHLMQGSSLNLLLTGGAGDDTLDAEAYIAANSTGQVNALDQGGPGNDTLTLDVFCPDDNTVTINAVIDGGPGVDTAFCTPNVRKINVER
jgi:hypothetical protein